MNMYKEDICPEKNPTNICRERLTLYAVTDRKWLKEEQTLAQQVEQAILGGVTVVQLREKNTDYETFLQQAREVKAVTDRYNVPLLINDNIDVAIAVDAAGVHVGQEDLEAGKARERLGEKKVIGVSAKTVEQALAAEQAGADYLGVGAMFPTESKGDASATSYETLKAICAAVEIPVVAIGGINGHNMMQLQGSGIVGVAVISAIFGQEDVRAAAEGLSQQWSTLRG